jgi:hypothetical protein
LTIPNGADALHPDILSDAIAHALLLPLKKRRALLEIKESMANRVELKKEEEITEKPVWFTWASLEPRNI